MGIGGNIIIRIREIITDLIGYSIILYLVQPTNISDEFPKLHLKQIFRTKDMILKCRSLLSVLCRRWKYRDHSLVRVASSFFQAFFLSSLSVTNEKIFFYILIDHCIKLRRIYPWNVYIYVCSCVLILYTHGNANYEQVCESALRRLFAYWW